ncbi:MAG: outer membrane lipoprotein-sorting protein [Candidatus Omnitrophica bacterium]|nr:outer membrane lipoprotein-sorting protein [Candidatus Omnitrophota bacterium]
MKNRVAAILAVCCFFCVRPALAAELSASQIIEKVDEVRSPQGDYTIFVDVTSFSSAKDEKKASYEVMIKGRENTIIKTIKPENERGRIMLMRDKNLWAFFPDVSKPIRLSMQERLIGDVANGDIARANFSGDYNPRVLREEKIDGKACYVLELSARTPDVTYGRAVLWAQKENFWPIKAEFYAISGKLLKTCAYGGFSILGDRVRPTQLIMVDPLIKGKRSIIQYGDLRVGELPEKYFTKDYMKKLMD